MPDGDVVDLLAISHVRSGDLDDQKAPMTSPTTAPRTNTLALIGFIAAFVLFFIPWGTLFFSALSGQPFGR